MVIKKLRYSYMTLCYKGLTDAVHTGQPGIPSVILNVFGVWRDNVGWVILRDSGMGRAGTWS